MAKLTLYHAAPSRSSISRWMLEETGEPYDIHLLNLSRGDSRTADYLAVNQMGKVPALKARRHRHHRGCGDLHLSRRRISPRQAQRADRHATPRRLSQVAVLRPELHRGGDDRSAPARARKRHGARCWATAILTR